MNKYFSKKQIFDALEPVRYSNFTFEQLEKYLENAESTSANDIFNASVIGKEIDDMLERIQRYKRTILPEQQVSYGELSMHASILRGIKRNLGID